MVFFFFLNLLLLLSKLIKRSQSDAFMSGLMLPPTGGRLDGDFTAAWVHLRDCCAVAVTRVCTDLATSLMSQYISIKLVILHQCLMTLHTCLVTVRR